MYLKKGAILIADSHYPTHKKEEFLSFLYAIENRTLKTEQLFLMGDIFDLLVGTSSYLKNEHKEEIALINKIAQKIEVYYLEGNHDFCLKNVFNQNVKIIPIQNQPLILTHNSKTYALAHGDIHNKQKRYLTYSKIIRSKIVLSFIPDFVAKIVLKKLSKKRICKEIKNFQSLVKSFKTKTDYAIEGHFHQGITIDNYTAMPSFACSQKVGRFNGECVEFLEVRN